MSLKPFSACVVPERTASVARAAFLKGSLCIELLPDKHLVDAGYIEASNLVESRREYDIDLIGPAQSNGRWQQVQGNGFDISKFRIEWDREKVICPAGRESSSWKPMVDGRGNDFIHVAFARSDCSVCAHFSQCTSAKGRRRTVNIKPKELHERDKGKKGPLALAPERRAVPLVSVLVMCAPRFVPGEYGDSF